MERQNIGVGRPKVSLIVVGSVAHITTKSTQHKDKEETEITIERMDGIRNYKTTEPNALVFKVDRM